MLWNIGVLLIITEILICSLYIISTGERVQIDPGIRGMTTKMKQKLKCKHFKGHIKDKRSDKHEINYIL